MSKAFFRSIKTTPFNIPLESLSWRRFCQHRRQPEVNRAVIDGEWWRQPFSFEISTGSHSAFTLVISNENGWRHHSSSITTRFTSRWRPCWQKRRLLKLPIIYTARNAKDLLQVVDFICLVQVVNKLQQVCWIHQVAASLWKSGLLQLDICRLDASCWNNLHQVCG